MKPYALTITTATLITAGLSAGAAVTNTAVEIGSIHVGGDTASNEDGTEFYASGNDDAFSEYGVATFLFGLSDFGGSLPSLSTATFNLTINDRFFSDGSQLEVLFSADDFDSDYTGLDYNAGLSNGLDVSEFTSLTSLGIYAVPDTSANGGTVVPLALDFSAAEAELITEITNGSEFQLIIAVTDAADDITFSGVGNTFDPGAPSLTFVPEPTSLALLGLGGLLVARRRRG